MMSLGLVKQGKCSKETYNESKKAAKKAVDLAQQDAATAQLGKGK